MSDRQYNNNSSKLLLSQTSANETLCEMWNEWSCESVCSIDRFPHNPLPLRLNVVDVDDDDSTTRLLLHPSTHALSSPLQLRLVWMTSDLTYGSMKGKKEGDKWKWNPQRYRHIISTLLVLISFPANQLTVVGDE